MTGRPKGFKFIFRLLTVHRELIIYSIDSNYGKTLLRHLAILCGIHVGHGFYRLCIDTTWVELSHMTL